MTFATDGGRDGRECIGFEVSEGGEVFSTDQVGLTYAVGRSS